MDKYVTLQSLTENRNEVQVSRFNIKYLRDASFLDHRFALGVGSWELRWECGVGDSWATFRMNKMKNEKIIIDLRSKLT